MTKGLNVNNLNELLEKRKEMNGKLLTAAPNLYNGFGELMKEYYKPSALDIKYKELIAVGLSIGVRCIPCVAYHANEAIRHGATKQQVLDAAAIGVEFGGGPSFVIVRNELLDVLEQIEETPKS